MKQARRCALIALLVMSLVVAPRRAHADAAPFGPVFAVAGAIVLAAFVVNTVFTVHDVNDAAHGDAPTTGWATPEIIVAAPQALLLDIGLSYASRDERPSPGLQGFLLVTGSWTSALAAHGIWGVAHPETEPLTLFGGATSVGVDTMLFTTDLSCAIEGHLAPRVVGVGAIFLTMPQVVTSAYRASKTAGSERSEWIALTAVSGTLFAHGVASAILGKAGSEGPEPDELPPPPPPPPDGYPPPRTLKRAVRLHYPKPTLRVAPGMLSGALGPGYGVTAAGRF